MVFGSFSSSSFICLGVTLVLIGILGYLISKKFQDQNQKISAMCELVTTMAQDLQMIKMQNAVDKIQNSINNSSSHSSFSLSTNESGTPALQQKENDTVLVGEINCREISSNDFQNKIVVSDDDYSLDESDNESESSLEDFEEDVDNSSDDEIEITEVVMSDETPIKHIQLTLDIPAVSVHEEEETHAPPILVNKLENIEMTSINFLDETVEVVEFHDMSTNEEKTNPSFSVEIKQKKSKNSRANLDDVDEHTVSEDFSGDYSKLNVSQLKKLVTERGLSSHATKLKKMELLQLLSGSSSVGVVELNDIDM